jgi:predicted RNA-binding protein with PIN domain
MYFLIDGYNLLFSFLADRTSFEVQREGLLIWMQKQFDDLNLTGIVVFDGGHQMPYECEISYQSPLEIAYTPKGQTADAYIVERLSYFSNTGTQTASVVTNDKGLIGHCRTYSPQMMSNESFVQWLMKKSKKIQVSKKKVLKESSFQVDRLTRIFEEKLRSEE